MTNRTLRHAAAALSVAMFAPAARSADPGSNLRADEHVILFPAAAMPSEDRGWRVAAHAWVFEKESYEHLLPALAEALGFEGEAVNVTRDPLFRERAQWFLVDNERAKRLAMRIGPDLLTLGDTGPDGHVREMLALSVGGVAHVREAGAPRIEVISGEASAVRATAPVHLVLPKGLSIICDVDDTLKISEVRDRAALLRNTFLRDFEAVPGMPSLLTRWAAEPTAIVHYVTASPWQLYPPLSAFFDKAGYPDGLWHMKPFRLADRTFFGLFQSPQEYKTATIEPILAAYPARRFVLIGDSGERDPEAYGDLGRRYPEQVRLILIRDVTDEPRRALRYESAFRDLPEERWIIFTDPSAIPAMPPD